MTDRSVASPASAPPVRVLLVEDDDGDAFLVEELLREDSTSVRIELTRAQSLGEALDLLPGSVECVLLDLGLPDSAAQDPLDVLLQAAPGTAVIVLTGLADEHRGVAAVAAGAQDYLVKGMVDGALLGRAIRYAVERKRADESVRRLYASELRAAENARLSRGLLPQPLVSERLDVATTYRPGGTQAVLGGDFFDVVETKHGEVVAIIGDVAGHGPDEAALGVCLRIAWRTLVLAGAEPDSILPSLHDVLVSERPSDEVFATAAMVRVDRSARTARFWLAGHPAPLVVRSGSLCASPDRAGGPALGIVDGMRWLGVDEAVDDSVQLLLYTDGLIEGFVEPGSRTRLGDTGLRALLTDLLGRGLDGAEMLDALLEEVTRRNGGELTDDVAVLRLAWRGR